LGRGPARGELWKGREKSVAGTGGRSSGLACEILQSGFQLDIPCMFAALLLITLAGVALFVFMVTLSKLVLEQWHESEIGADT
jgi:NitT/TauT family transport system permease protein